MTSGIPIPVRHVETGAVYASIHQAVRAVLGREPHGRHFYYFDLGMPVAPGLTLVALTEEERQQVTLPPLFRNGRRYSHKAQPVRCIETGVVYESAMAAGKAIFAESSSIYKAIRRGTPCFGHHFAYAEEAADDAR